MEKNNRVHAKPSRIIAIAILVVASIAIAIGVVQGEALIVLKKATTICLECIGLG